jgi:Flp pilus assembly protein TadB
MRGGTIIMLKKTFLKLLSIYLVFAIVLITLPAQGWAMFIPSQTASTARQADTAAIQKTLESTVVKQHLMDYGLSSEEAMARINKLSDEQVHQFASKLDSLQAGADDGLDALAFILVVTLLVILILEVTGHHVIVR